MMNVKVWFQGQWMCRKFRILTGLYLALTLVMGVEFYLFRYGWLKSIRYLVLFWFLCVLAWIDQEKRRIPNRILQALFGVRTAILLLECLLYQEYWMSIVISAVLGMIFSGGMFLLCYMITRGGIGAGDVKLLTVLGYCLGTRAIFTAVFLTVLSAAVFSGGALVSKKTDLKKEIPFAPFILAGTVMTMMLGV